ncbi:MAG: division/cell wall cluster transcriptional repressor MraZ [Anaerolineales bacterium]|jgi:MraZ protein
MWDAGMTGVSYLRRMVELMFLGQFYHNLDNKGRLIIPSRFREVLAVNGAYVMQGFEENLLVLAASTFDLIAQRINQMSMTDPKTRLLRRLVFSTANFVEMDKSGRILIPQFLRSAAKLDVEVVVVGNGSYFELWAPQNWSSQVEQIHDTQVNAHRFAELNLASD